MTTSCVRNATICELTNYLFSILLNPSIQLTVTKMFRHFVLSLFCFTFDLGLWTSQQ